MASFDLFGNSSRCDITVGYISTDRGFVDGIGIHEANKYAQLNPGTQFIFRNRDFVKYLNINQVNKLTPDMMLPQKNSAFDKCSGIVGLNPTGDTTQSVDDFLSRNVPPAGGSTQSPNVPVVVDKTKVDFYGGGGVGVQANPVIGDDGAILDVDVVHGGFGYKYPPIVDIHDDTGSGAGVVAHSLIKTSTDSNDYFIEEYDSEDDFEEYDLNSCVSTLENVSYGQRFGSDGKVLGKWDPFVYLNTSKDPVAQRIDEYQSFLLSLGEGTRIENGLILGWWSSRKNAPIKIVGPNGTSRTKYDVYHWAWGSNPGTNDEIDNLYIKLFGRRGEPSGLAYWKNLRASGQSLAQIEEGMKLQPEWQRVCEGECIPVMPDVTYLFGQYYEYDKDNFMNKNAISPIPMSNVLASDNAGQTYTFEWEENFPFVGEYIFNIQCDNTAYMFIDGEPLKNSNGQAVFKLGSGGAEGHVLSAPSRIKHNITRPGVHRITATLENTLSYETKTVQTAIDDIGVVSNEVTFNISISTMFATGITIEGLEIDVSKPYDEGTNPLKETITKKVEYGRVYPVKIRSSGFQQETSSLTPITLSGLKNPGDVRFANSTRLEFDDDSSNGFDVNASFTIDKVNGGTAKFTSDAKSLNIKGDNVEITLTYSWADNPRISGTALDSIKIGSTTWTHLKQSSGSETHTITLSGAVGNSDIELKTKGEKVIVMEDLPGQDAGSVDVGFFDDLICSVSAGKFYGISGNTCKFILTRPDDIRENTSNIPNIFNTLDWITRADRTLWKTNPDAGVDANFSQKYGVTPFNPIPPAEITEDIIREEVIIPEIIPTVKFEVGDDGKNYLKVVGDSKVKIGFEMNVDDSARTFGMAVREVKITADDGEIILKRSGARFETLSGTGVFSPGKKYLIKSLGGSQTSGSFIGADKTILQYDDAVQYGFDGRGYANVKVKSVSPLPITIQIPETVTSYPDYPHAATDDFAGFHDIVWNNITFPESGNYAVEIMVDDNVELVFSSQMQDEPNIIIKKEGFKIESGSSVGTGKAVEITYFKKGSYTLKAILEQRAGATISAGNPMMLAVNIKAAFVSDEFQVISQKSWNENPMGIALVIDAPLSPPPAEPPLLQEGRCPNNPIWSTRMTPNSSDYVIDIVSSWWPVRVDSWSKFSNRYAISPLPPLSKKGTDGSGGKFSTAWKVDIPYRGFYGLKGTVDNVGRILIDSQEVLGPNADKNLQSVKLQTTPDMVKILLEKGVHQIEIEVENDAQYKTTRIDKKVFSTADWASTQNTTSTFIEGPKNIDVTFKVSIGTLYGAGIKLFDGNTVVFDDDKAYAEPAVSETHIENIEVGKVYDVEFTSTSKVIVPGSSGIQFIGLNASNSPIQVTNNGKRLALKDGDGDDANASFTIDSGDVKFSDDGMSLVGTGSVKFTLSWNDRPRTAGVAVQRIQIGTTTWTQSGRSGSETHTIQVGASNDFGNNNSNIQLRNKGKNVIEMEDIPGDFSAGTGGTNDENAFYKDVVCSATDGEFYNIQGRTCKFKISSKDRTEIEYGRGLVDGSSKDGVTYEGPPISTYTTSDLGPTITPTWTTDEDYITNFNGKEWVMTWKGVDFPEDATYDIRAIADDVLLVKIDSSQLIARADVHEGMSHTQANITQGKHDVELTLSNIPLGLPFYQNPTVAAVKITYPADVAVRDENGEILGKSWKVNPIGIAAALIPPPCPKKINGVGIVTDVIIDDPGNSFQSPDPPIGGGDPTSYPVILECPEISTDGPTGNSGINYGPGDLVCIQNTETGEEICYEPEFGPFGEIENVIIPPDEKMTGFKGWPNVRVRTGVNKGPQDPGDPFTPPGRNPEGDPDPPPDPRSGGDPGIPTPTVTITAIPPVILEGNTSELIYTSDGNTSLTIDQGVGPVPVTPRGSIKVKPSATTTYTILGDSGASATTLVTVVKDPDDPLLGPPPTKEPKKVPTGIGFVGIPRLKTVRDPITADATKLIQVTDLVGLKQTGFYDGKPYYGAVFYEDGIRYAGYYDTPGQKVRIYDTLQESIDAEVTTPPSAIQRQGTDINSNNPRLNIPGTPDNLT